MSENSEPTILKPDQHLERLPPTQLAKLIRVVLASAAPKDRHSEIADCLAEVLERPIERVDRWLYGLFKLLVDRRRSQARWETLQAELRDVDRESIVLIVWQILERDYGERVEEKAGSLSYHRLWLFDWFSWRYDLRRARRTLGAGLWLSRAHVLLVLAVLAVLVARRLSEPSPVATLGSILGVGAVYAAVVSVQARSFLAGLGRPASAWIAAVNSLVPRLLGACAVGLMALASSEELLRLVAGAGHRRLWPLWLTGLLLVSFGYLLLEMGRRVHPLPSRRRLILHAADILVTALAHGAALALIAEGGLTRILSSPLGGPPFTWGQSLSVIVFIVTIGLIVNLIWAEQPVTEPL